ncbi:MAG: VPDSG-CTERM sorting domain-containing protein [Opitutaceae bacterium]|nr:VPDSG-CTERM sorting domain-containing protein [Opitutaceae bacterium]
MKLKTLFSSAVLALGLGSVAHAATFTYNFATNGSDVLTASPSSATAGAPSVSVTAWSTTNFTSWTQGNVTQNGSAGMGARTHNNDSHTVDNGTRFEFLLFSFGAAVDVNSFRLGYIDGDSDYRWSVGNTSNLTTLYSTGTDGFNAPLSPSVQSINPSNILGSYLLLGTTPNSNYDDDRFKVNQLIVDYTTPPPTQGVPDSGATLILLGLGLLGLAGLKRRMAA